MRSMGSTITLHMTVNGAFYGILVLKCVQLRLRIKVFSLLKSVSILGWLERRRTLQ